MDRRTLLVSGSSTLLFGCDAAPSGRQGAISRSGVRLQGGTYPAAVLIGAALGFAVARYTGGSPIVGIAVGAFAGTVTNAALEYSQYLIRENDAELVPSYRALTSAVNEDFENFSSENIPILEEKRRIFREAGLDRLDETAVSVADSLNRLNESEAALSDLALPNTAYQDSVPIYQQTSPLLPQISDQQLTPEAITEKGIADAAISASGAIIIATAQEDLAVSSALRRRGLL